MAVKTKATNQATIDSKSQDINNFLPKMEQVDSDTGYGLEVGAEFPLIRNIGFDTISCIFELIDNSVDAEASKIYVWWVRDEKTKLYTLRIKDNGIGVPRRRVVPVFTKLGIKERYLINRTGHYGIGAKATLINLLLDGTATITTTHEGVTSIFNITHTKDNDVKKVFGYYDDPNAESGTMIVIPGIKSKLQVERLIREISCVYYPNTENYDDFSIIVNDKEIDFVDPLYRHLNGNTDGKFTWDRTFTFKKSTLDIQGVSLLPDFKDKYMVEKHYDTQGGKAKLRNDNGGLYFRVPGRYTSTGQRFFVGNDYFPIFRNLRLEVQVPKSLFEEMGIGVNKNRLVFDDSDPAFDNFKNVVAEIMSDHRKMVEAHRGQDVSSDDKNILKRLNKQLNALIGDKGREKNITAQVGDMIKEKRKSPENNTGTVEEGNGSTRDNLSVTQPARKPKQSRSLPNPLNLEFVNKGVNGSVFEYYRQSSTTLQIKVNRQHRWVENLMKNNEAAMASALLKIYTYIHAGSKLAASMDEPEEYRDFLTDLVDAETRLLNKLLK
tara:strand:- start:57 stop:1706 length:1650 start_codon:yes stop_codon:yes gene_type:complete